MRTYTTVEEYLEVLAGFREPDSGKIDWSSEFKPIINLARYDIKVLTNMSESVLNNNALTERQGELLVKIILKYERQFASKQIDITPVRTPTWRVTLRKMDYTRSIKIKDNQIIVGFPFDAQLIDQIKTFAKDSHGTMTWDRNNKLWTAALTEYNLSWLETWATLNQFEIDCTIVDIMMQIKAVEQTEYNIELYIDNDTLDIHNCPNTLKEYIDSTQGGFVLDNILRLVDISSTLGYTVAGNIREVIIKEYGARFYHLLTHREIKINPGTLLTGKDFDSVLDYAETMGRWPIVVYEPDLSNRMLTKLTQRYGAENQSKYIHIIRPIRNLEHIPILISSAGMVFGGDKQLMLQRAEKIVYCVEDVYNKKSPGRVKLIAS